MKTHLILAIVCGCYVCLADPSSPADIDTIITLTPDAVCGKERLSKLESELLDEPFTPTNPRATERRYSLFKVISYSHSRLPSPCQVRVWGPDGISWPGLNYQIIEVIKDGTRLSSIRVGGEPIMEDAWGYAREEGLLVHILCRHRWGPMAKGVYVYSIDTSATITYVGLFFQKSDVEGAESVKKERFQRMLDRIDHN